MEAEKLRERLAGYKITYLAEKTGIHYNTIQRFMAGSDPKLSTAEKLNAWLKEKNDGQIL